MATHVARADRADRPARAVRPVPERARVGLLDYLTTHALDEDYAYVSAKRAQERPRTEQKTSRRLGPLGAVVVAVFAMLVVVAAVQTSQNADSEAQERSELAGQVRAAQRQLTADQKDAATLRRDVSRLTADGFRSDASTRALLARVRRLRVLSGTAAVKGPGVRFVADDAPGARSARGQVLDADLQKLVNGLWAAGAEAIAINGQRLTNLSTVREAGGAITVNAHSLGRPYVVSAIGDKNQLQARFAETSSGQAWSDLQRSVGLRLTSTPVDSMRLPAAEVSLRYAVPTKRIPGGDR